MSEEIIKQTGNAVQVAHAGKVVRGRWVDESSPVAKTLKKCVECALREGCEKFDEKYRCFYQIQNLKAEYKMQGALTSGDPRDLLKNIQATIARLESVINYDEMVGQQPKKADLKELAFLKLQVYEMVYGRRTPQVAVQVNAPQTTIDVKALMKKMRGEEVGEEEVKKDEQVEEN